MKRRGYFFISETDLFMCLSNMFRSITKAIRAITLLSLLVGCKDIATFTSSPYPDVSVRITAHKVSHHDNETTGNITLVHFKYNITVRSDTPVYFRVENISTSLNGVKSNEAYYDTIASIVPHWKQMQKGENTFNAYVVFQGTIDASAIPNLKFINYGLSREVKKGN